MIPSVLIPKSPPMPEPLVPLRVVKPVPASCVRFPAVLTVDVKVRLSALLTVIDCNGVLAPTAPLKLTSPLPAVNVKFLLLVELSSFSVPLKTMLPAPTPVASTNIASECRVGVKRDVVVARRNALRRRERSDLY